MKHLLLVGLPGSGKTTVGRAAAALAGLPFLDFDEEIARRSGLTTQEFFQRYGEAAFRREELALSGELVERHTELVERHTELVERHTIVVAPGGGWITQEAARSLLRPRSCLVYLKVSPETAIRRLGDAVSSRPLLASGSPLQTLQELLAAREALYTAADEILDTEVIDLPVLTDYVARLARSCLERAC